MLLELADGSAYEGYSFGADKTISGECVFQTGALMMLLTWQVSLSHTARFSREQEWLGTLNHSLTHLTLVKS